MEIKIFNKHGVVVDTDTLRIEDGIIYISGFASYYIESLQRWFEKNSPVLCIDAGRDEYVFTQPLKDFIAQNK